MFVAAYGAEAGNLALRTVATAGVYVGGGIAPKILPAIASGGFVDAFRAKEPMARSSRRFPIAVILNAEAGLLGAAVHANSARDTIRAFASVEETECLVHVYVLRTFLLFYFSLLRAASRSRRVDPGQSRPTTAAACCPA
jgi:hypothetical protein